MRVINTTDIAKGTGVKVIGIGEYRIMPGESAEIPDSIAYILDGGKKIIAPSIVALARTNQIRYEEAPVAPPSIEPQSSDGAPAGDGGTDQTYGENENSNEPEMTEDEKKKAEAAAKRKAAREAKKAAEASAKAAAENKAE